MSFIPALGQSDFRSLREDGAGYIDKTAFIAELLADPTQVVLFPRPRRFGKTINLSALQYYLGKSHEDLSHLFEGLAVWNNPAARAHFQRYPVLFLTFKDVKYNNYETAFRAIRSLIQGLYTDHRYLLSSRVLR